MSRFVPLVAALAMTGCLDSPAASTGDLSFDGGVGLDATGASTDAGACDPGQSFDVAHVARVVVRTLQATEFRGIALVIATGSSGIPDLSRLRITPRALSGVELSLDPAGSGTLVAGDAHGRLEPGHDDVVIEQLEADETFSDSSQPGLDFGIEGRPVADQSLASFQLELAGQVATVEVIIDAVDGLGSPYVADAKRVSSACP